MSGINKGWNIGDDVTYSGTVAGALEGGAARCARLAVSLERDARRRTTSVSARSAAATLAAAMLRGRLPPRTFLNINVPKGQPKAFA